MVLFSRNYTFKTCEFECFLRKSNEKCGCTPWNYPQPSEDISEICDGPKSYCFETAMKSGYLYTDCGCKDSCEEIQYQVSDMFLHPIDTTYECVRESYSPQRFKTDYYSEQIGTVTNSEVVALAGKKYHFLYGKNDVALMVGEKLRLVHTNLVFIN